VSDVTDSPPPAQSTGITAQLIRPTDRTSVIMIVWPAVVSKFLILEAGVEYSYSVAAPNTRQERRSWLQSCTGRRCRLSTRAERAKRSEIRYAVIKTLAELGLAVQPRSCAYLFPDQPARRNRPEGPGDLQPIRPVVHIRALPRQVCSAWKRVIKLSQPNDFSIRNTANSVLRRRPRANAVQRHGSEATNLSRSSTGLATGCAGPSVGH
jgi:hypothetical protein